MSSILTNTSSMVALQTLKGINSNLQKVQSEISTGKSVNSAKDNAALWAISKVMESDVAGFKAVKESLALGESSVAVARNASETVTDLLTDIKSKVIASQESNVDREKIQTDIRQLTDQIKAVTGAAQFNGLNLVQGQEDVDVLASLDRSANGGVASNSITVARQDLTFDKGVLGNGTALSDINSSNTTATSGELTNGNVTLRLGGGMDSSANPTAEFGGDSNDMLVSVAGTLGNSEKMDLTIGGTTVSFTTASSGSVSTTDIAAGFISAINSAGIEGITATASGTQAFEISSTSKFADVSVSLSAPTGAATFALDSGNAGGSRQQESAANSVVGTIQSRASDIEFSATAVVQEGDGYRVSFGGINYDYIAGKGETFEDVAKGLKTVIDGAGLANIETKVTQDSTSGAWSLQIDNAGSATDIVIAARQAGTTGEASGGLLGLDTLDVTDTDKANAALENIETLIQNSIDAAAEFGSVAGRIETQTEFISNLTDSLKAGIGTLVDADMEEASARLQALQVQQQLGVQSLSIANQAPQSLLSLFR